MKSDQTAGEIAGAFLQLSRCIAVEKITISEIVDACGKHRKTFYYHFFDKDQLVIWIFRRELGCLLDEAYPSDKLVYESDAFRIESESCVSTKMFPYYVHNEVGFCSLDHAHFFQILAEALERHRSVFAQSLSNQRSNPLRKHLLDLYSSALRRDVDFMLGNRYLKPKNLTFLADFYTTAFINTLIQAVQASDSVSVPEMLAPQGNLIHNSLRREIEEQRLSRMP